MPAPVLSTKLNIPPRRPKAVLRPRLIRALDDGLHRKLTLISAPAGFGKTMLTSEWAARSDRQAAWLSLDRGESDPLQFLVYFVAALQKVIPGFGNSLMEALQSSQPPPTDAVLTALINEISSFPNHFTMILDDYHLVDAKEVDDALSFLIERQPQQMHLVIASREDPQLPLPRLRARGELNELRAADLRFNPAEAGEFMNQVMGLNLPDNDIEALEARTEGWIAGLQIAALSLQRVTDRTSRIESFTGSHRFVLDYLVEEVLGQQPSSVQKFLLRTAILDRMCGALCEAVLRSPAGTGQETLEYLERANLMLVPLDDRREWYRYHHLFSQALKARLIRELPDRAAELHLLASEWWSNHGFRLDAIQHALAGGDFERAADLLEMEWLENSGKYYRNPAWLGWVESLPDDLVRARPRLSVGLAWEMLHSGELEAAEKRLRDAGRYLEPQGRSTDLAGDPPWHLTGGETEEFRPLQAPWSLALAFLSQARGDSASTIEYAYQVLSLVTEENYFMRSLASAQIGLARWTTGDLEAACESMADAMAGLLKDGNLLFAQSCVYVLAEIRSVQGRLREAIQIFKNAIELAEAAGEPFLLGTADLHLGLSELHRERGEAQAAERHLRRSLEQGEQAGLDEWQRHLWITQARTRETEGDLDGALEMLEKAEELYYRSPVPDVRPTSAWKARVWIRQDRLAEAQAWVQSRGLSTADPLGYLREFEHITLARLLVARQRTGTSDQAFFEANGLLSRLLSAAEAGGRIGSAIEILVLQALAHQEHGNMPLALAALERALKMAEPEGYFDVFLREGKPMAELLTRLKPEDGAQRAYIGRIAGRIDKPQLVRSRFGDSQALIEPLSERELEVLQLVASGLSNREIGERLFLALSTVKGHNRRIFDKLQVQRRTEAVRRARVLGLLPLEE